MLLDSKNIYYYLIGFSLIVFVNFFGTKLKDYFEDKGFEFVSFVDDTSNIM